MTKIYVLNGVERIINVIAMLALILGLINAYSVNAAANAYTYTNAFGSVIEVPAKSFNFTGFLGSFAIWGLIITILYFLVIAALRYIVKGFKTPSDKSHK